MRIIVALSVVLFAAPAAGEISWVESLDFRMRNRVVVGVETGDGRFQMAELTMKPELDVEFAGGMSAKMILRLRADAFDRLEPGDSSQPEIDGISRRFDLGQRADAELRELWLDGRLGPVYIRAGKQQTVWGKADGLKVLDLVNPQDFREFILDDFEDSRIPLWSVTAEVPIGPVSVEAVWVLDPSYHDIPEPDALYAFTAPFALPAVPAGSRPTLLDPKRPDRNVRDSDVGVRVSGFFEGWDWTLNWLYHYHDIPIPFRTDGFEDGVAVSIFEPGYRRTHLIGGTFSNAFGDLTIRGELGYSFTRFFSDLDPRDPDGVSRSGELAYVLGLDWWGFRDTLLSVQVFQSWLTGYRSSLEREKLDTTLSFLARRTYLNETLRLELIALYNVEDHDGLVRPKVSYDLADDLKIWIGLDLFFGTSEGLFGEFDARDRAVIGLEWTL